MSWLAHFRHAARVLRKSPTFTAIAVASLALGIGANVAIFSLLDQILFRALPVRNPGQLVLFQSANPVAGGYHGDSMLRLFSYPMYADLRNALRGGQTFDGLIAECPIAVNLRLPGHAEAASGELVSGNFFDVLGLRPALGRLLAPQDDSRGGQAVAVLGYGFWTRRFGADSGVIGRQIRVNSALATVIGIAPKDFYGAALGPAPDVYIPLAMQPQTSLARIPMENRNQHWLHILGRLKSGVTVAQAAAAIQAAYQPALRAELATVQVNLAPEARQRLERQALLLKPGSGGVPGFQEEAQAPLYLLMAMVGLVLLIACVNAANLMVARGLDRQREIAVRLAVGARRQDVVRQLLAESLTLSGLGADAGILIAVWTTAGVLRFLGTDSSWISADPSRHTLLAAAAFGIGCGILSGLFPALQASRSKLYPVLKDQAASVVGSGSRWRRALVVAQVALSLLLVVGAGLFTRTLINLWDLNPGFRTDHLVAFSVDASLNGYSQARIRQLYQTIQQRTSAMPGVVSAALGNVMLLSGDQDVSGIRVESREVAPGEDNSSEVDIISPGFFSTMEIPLLRGRDFFLQDGSDAPKVAIINETFARQYFGEANPLGRKIVRDRDGEAMEIIGVAKDTKYDSLRYQTRRMVYFPVQQQVLGRIVVHVRTVGAPEPIVSALRQEMAQIDPALAIPDLKTMQQQVDESLLGERLIAFLCSIFGVLATLLAAIGLYGVTAFSVARRTREIGIRMALGAERERVLRMVLKEVALLCVLGVVVGLPAAAALARLARSQLFGVEPADPTTLAGSAALMLVVSLASGFLPARRAASVDPTEALRYE